MRYTHKQGKRDYVITVTIKLSFYELSAMLTQFGFVHIHGKEASEVVTLFEKAFEASKEPL